MQLSLGVSAWCFHDALYAGRLTLHDIPAAAAALGFDLVELNDLFYPPPRFSRLRYLPWRVGGKLSGRDPWRAFQRSWVSRASTRQRLRDACDQAGVRCAVFTLNSDFTGQPRQQPAALAYVAAGLATTAALGAPIMRVTSDCRERSDDMTTPGVLERVIGGLRQAVKLQDGLRYMEPPPWFFPERHALGAVLLRAGRAKEAEAVYREDLARNPGNGWALHGLAQSLRAQKKTEQADEAEAKLREAWGRADVPLVSSRY